jgi:glycerophosphoryl diester phosphodiesterase
MNKCFKCLYLFLLVTIFIAGLFFGIVGALFAYTQYHSTSTCIPPTTKYTYAHRSWTKQYQENTLDGILATVDNNIGAEFDLCLSKDNEIVIMHDDNLLDETGIDKNVSEMTWSEISQLQVLQTIHGVTYDKTRPIPTFKQVVDGLCAKDASHDMDIDIKFSLTEDNVKLMFTILDASPCKCDSSQHIIFASPYFYQMKTLREVMEKSRCQGNIVLWFYPDTYPMGEYFWMKTRGAAWIGKPDIINAHYTIWDTYPELLTEYNNEGWCTAVYGSYATDLAKYNVNTYTVVDVSAASLETVTYSSEKSTYNWLIALFVIGIIIWLISLILMIRLCCCGGKKNKIGNDA